jgi:V/A-type H+/Na+-transporting ATPase subunit F
LNYFIIGDEDSVLGFGMVGVPGRVATSTDQVQAAFDEAISKPENGIIIMTEEAASHISSVINAYIFTHDFPLIVEVPGSLGRISGKPGLREMVNEAIGINL